MIIVGAGGHAKEILGVLRTLSQTYNLYFYDDKSPVTKVFEEFSVLKNKEEAKLILKQDPYFILGVGNPQKRFLLNEMFESLGGILTSVISPFAAVGSYQVKLGDGINIMPGAVVMEDIQIGKGSLIHVQSSVHHDCRIGDFCEILPGSHILGNVIIGDFSSIGSGAIVLPNVRVGSRVVVGAGSVVTKNLPDDVVVKGILAR